MAVGGTIEEAFSIAHNLVKACRIQVCEHVYMATFMELSGMIIITSVFLNVANFIKINVWLIFCYQSSNAITITFAGCSHVSRARKH